MKLALMIINYTIIYAAGIFTCLWIFGRIECHVPRAPDVAYRPISLPAHYDQADT
jgi:hypothetical protein